VQYPEGVAKEHRAVRENAGLFDVSHMGEFDVRGPGAETFVNKLVANDVARLAIGQALYSVMCMDDGGIVDDLLIYKFADRFRLVVNAANIEKDWQWIDSLLANHEDAAGVEMVNESDDIALLALQGPKGVAILSRLTEDDLSSIGYYRFIEGQVDGCSCVISRTGYTGEDGFELYCAPEAAAALWRAILQAGGEEVKPVGLGARDTLRLEMGYALYGNDIDEGTTPLEAGLGWTVKLDKGDFVGQNALLTQKEKGLSRKLCGFTLTERGFPRPGHEIRCGGTAAGTVRSGTVGPSVGEGIGTGYLPSQHSAPGTEIEIVIRDRAVPAVVTRMPFYKGGSIKR
jgi:aminomethyltransferase